MWKTYLLRETGAEASSKGRKKLVKVKRKQEEPVMKERRRNARRGEEESQEEGKDYRDEVRYCSERDGHRIAAIPSSTSSKSKGGTA